PEGGVILRQVADLRLGPRLGRTRRSGRAVEVGGARGLEAEVNAAIAGVEQQVLGEVDQTERVGGEIPRAVDRYHHAVVPLGIGLRADLHPDDANVANPSPAGNADILDRQPFGCVAQEVDGETGLVVADLQVVDPVAL